MRLSKRDYTKGKRRCRRKAFSKSSAGTYAPYHVNSFALAFEEHKRHMWQAFTRLGGGPFIGSNVCNVVIN